MSHEHVTEVPRENVEVLEIEATPTVVVRVKDYPMDQMGTLFDSALSAIYPALESVGIQPAGPVFALHTRMPTATCDMEVGVPVSAPLGAPVQDGELVLINSEIPSGRAATITHMGSYDDLAAAWGRFVDTVSAQGERMAFPFWEVYVSDPTVDVSSLRTDLWTSLQG